MDNDLWFFENGKKRRAERKICENCGDEFLKRRNGKQRFCSYECGYQKNKKRITILCFNCGKSVDKQPSKLKNSKHGYYFCSRECKEEAQRLGGKCPEIRPPHYGTSKGKEFLKQYKKEKKLICVGCGEDQKFLLQVHHIDGDKENNVDSNFEIVCSNCHIKRHLKLENGQWIFSTKSLTPRDLIDKF